MLITLDEYKRYFEMYSFWFSGCVVRHRDLFVFILEPEYTDEQLKFEEENDGDSSLRPKARLTFDLTREPGDRCRAGYMKNWQPVVIGAAQKPLSQSITIEQVSTYPSLDHKCFVTGSGPAYQDEDLKTYSSQMQGSDGDFLRGYLGKLKTLDGYLYACGGRRSIGKRLGKGQWQSFSQMMPVEEGNHQGFKDFDGWGENDIYAAGGRGDVWHFNGQDWRQIPFPCNYPTSAVCCGGDGNVYIATYDGIYMGRDNRWTNIGYIGTNLPIKDMVWYEGQVWCTNDYGLWTITDGKVSRADVPASVSACAGYLSVGEGVLLLAGYYGAVFKENGEWQTIVHFNVMEKLIALERRESSGQ